MTDPKNGPYYDPSSEREELRRIILLPQSFAVEDQLNLEKLFGALAKVRQRDLLFYLFAVEDQLNLE